MDMYQKVSRAWRRRQYEKMSTSGRIAVNVRKPLTVRVPKAQKGKHVFVEDASLEPMPVLVPVPKRFTILSSANDVVDKDWLEQALQRTLAEGRLNIIKVAPAAE